jgi:hypothetical protein
MGEKNIRKETKKKKKNDSKSSLSSIKPVIPQPEVIKKKKEN